MADKKNFGCVDCPASSAYRSERVKEPEEAALRIGDSCNMHFSRCQTFFLGGPYLNDIYTERGEGVTQM